MKKTLTLCALTLPAPAVIAETTTLDTVVVTASGFSQSAKEAPASITVIKQEELQKQQVDTIADVLKEVEGVDVRGGTGKNGGMDISIRGMPSTYTLILIDGRRQNVTSGVMPNGFGTTNTSFLPPMAAIERIEVIRGPMSTLYGSDAMGGVINIITRKMPAQWSSSLNIASLLQEDRNASNTQSINLYSAGPLIEDTLALSLRGSAFRRDASSLVASNNSHYKLTGRGLNPSQADTYTLGGKLNYQVNPLHSLWLDGDIARQSYDNKESEMGTLDTADKAFGYRGTLRFDRSQIALGHDGEFTNGISTASSLMYNVTETKGRTIPSDAVPKGSSRAGERRELKQTNMVLDSKWILPVTEDHKVTTGGQYLRAELRDGLVTDTYRQNSGSVFAENEWRILDNLRLTLGGRYEYHQAYSGQFNPRGYLVWDMTEEWAVKGGVSRGYKTPDLQQLQNGVNGVSNQGKDVSLGNSDLEPELSTSSEIGLYYDNSRGLSSSITWFYTQFKDKITSMDFANCAVSNVPGCITVPGVISTQDAFSKPVNVDKAKIQGVELNSEIPLPDPLSSFSLRLNYTYTYSRQQSGVDKGEALTNTPEHMANARLNWQMTDELLSWVGATYRGKATRFTSSYQSLSAAKKAEYELMGDKLKAYTVMDLGARYQVSENVSLNLVVYNLLDKDFYHYYPYTYKSKGKMVTDYASDYASSSASTSGYLENGRRFWLGANITF